jgi:glycosyltransferase involved in cell wall biosynthesis
VEVNIQDIKPATMLKAPFSEMDVLHIQHEFFMFDRLVGVTALLYYPWLWLWSKVLGFAIVTTIHSTYNVEDLEGALPHFRKFKVLFPLGAVYMRIHLWLVSRLSERIIILSKIGLENMQRVVSARTMESKVRYTHLGNYASNIRMEKHGLLAEKYGIAPSQKLFTLFGFAFPIKGYEYAIYAMETLVHELGRRDARLVVVSGETGKGSFPGGGQGGTYIGWLKQLTAERHLEPYVIFTGYLGNEDPLLEEVFSETLAFVFPYLDRNFPSGAISTTLATGKPMLVTDIRCFQEYEDLPSFPEKDSKALAQKMIELMDRPEVVEKAAKITRRNADKFGMERIFERHLEVYWEALGRGQ